MHRSRRQGFRCSSLFWDDETLRGQHGPHASIHRPTLRARPIRRLLNLNINHIGEYGSVRLPGVSMKFSLDAGAGGLGSSKKAKERANSMHRKRPIRNYILVFVSFTCRASVSRMCWVTHPLIAHGACSWLHPLHINLLPPATLDDPLDRAHDPLGDRRAVCLSTLSIYSSTARQTHSPKIHAR